MILFVVFLIGVSTASLPMQERYCHDTSSLALVYGMNQRNANRPFSERLRLMNIDIEDVLNKDDLLFQLGDMCRSQSLTFNWLLQQAVSVCPNVDQIRRLIEPRGVVCNHNGSVSELTKQVLRPFVMVNKSVECTFAYASINNDCETDAMFDTDIRPYPEQTLETEIDESTRIYDAAIRCSISGVERLAPACGSPRDLLLYSLISEFIQKQPFKIRGNVTFRDFLIIL